MDPGEGLFNGRPDKLHLDADSQNREEEEEAIEDQRRRDQELGNLLATAFDDLEDDDENDLNSVNGSQHITSDEVPSDCSHENSPVHPRIPPAGSNQPENTLYTKVAINQGSFEPSHIYPANEKNMGLYSSLNGYRSENNGYKTSEIHKFLHGYGTGDQYHDSEVQEDYHFGHLSTIHQVEFPNGDVNQSYIDSPTPQDLYRHSELNSQEQLMVMYGARMQEISRLTKELTGLRLERDKEVENLKRKALLLEAEKQGAFLSHKEAQNLLADQKSSISKLQHDIEDLRLRNITLEKSNEELHKELEVTKASAADLTQKVAILERNGCGLQSEKQVESLLKTMQQKHENQIRELQSQIDSFVKKLSQKDHECCALERKLRDAHRAQEALMVEKGNIINELNRQLEEAQQKVREYASSIEGEETIRLKVQLEETRKERKALEEKVASMSVKLESIERDLQQYESVTKMGLLDNENSSFESDSITHLGISQRRSSGSQGERKADNTNDTSRRSKYSNRDDLHSKLREELHRALQGQRSKREEIRNLQEELSTRERKIKTMKEQEKVYFAEAEKFKKNLSAVLERLKRQQEEAELLQGQKEELNSARAQILKLSEERGELEKELKDTKIQLENVKCECAMLHKQLSSVELKFEQSKAQHMDQASAEFLAFHDESLARLRTESSRHLEAQVVDFRVRMEQAQKECEELKNLYIEVCSAKRALVSQLQEEEAQVKKLTSDLVDAKEAQQSLEELHRQERELTRRLRVDLERERENSLKISQNLEQQIEERVKDRLVALQKGQENCVTELDEARKEAVAKVENLEKKILLLEQDVQLLDKLKEECAQLRIEVNEGPRRQQAEVERVSKELKQSRERVIQLEKRLRAEFQTQMDAMMAERDLIQSQLKQKDGQLEEYLQALSRIRPPCRDAFCNTDPENSDSIEKLRKHFEEQVTKLEMQRNAAEKQRLAAAQAQFKVALASTEEQVKEQTVRYFAEEISRIEEKHRKELGTLVKKLVDAETVKLLLQDKTQEVEDLKKKLALEKKEVLSVDDSGDAVKLRSRVKHLQEQMENDRNKMADAMSKWAAEVKELQDRESRIRTEFEQLRTKYKHAKRVVAHHKKLSSEREKQMGRDIHQIEERYRGALSIVKAKVGDIVGSQEKEVLDRLQQIESHYEAQIKELTNKLNQNKLSS